MLWRRVHARKFQMKHERIESHGIAIRTAVIELTVDKDEVLDEMADVSGLVSDGGIQVSG